jgi:hypothetical protein
MASLFNTLPQDTYSSLIKFIDNTGSAGPIKQLTDGVGVALPISFGTSNIYVTSISGSITGSFSGSLIGTSTTASYVLTAQTASYVLTAQTSSFVTASNVFGPYGSNSVISSSYALTASYALNAGAAVSTASLLTTASVNLNTITFTKGDASTFNITVNTGSASTVSTASLLITASVSLNTITFTKGDASTFNITVDTGSGGGGAVTSITNNTNDYILTATGGTTINGEGNLRFDGSALKVTGSVAISSSLAVGNISPSATVGRIDASNDVVAYSTSDIRLKENIIPILNPISKIEAIGGYTFDWKPEHKDLHGFEGHDIGVIAQEIEVIMPEVVTTRDNGYKAVKYEKLVPLLIEAIKDLQKQVDELKNR